MRNNFTIIYQFLHIVCDNIGEFVSIWQDLLTFEEAYLTDGKICFSNMFDELILEEEENNGLLIISIVMLHKYSYS